ncbi:MAG: glycosyltransferase [Scytolyngbya sp. HA4215-MV1]|nr:glycosyltransferase [Scytolyngbya sp. HA4215-MV1]
MNLLFVLHNWIGYAPHGGTEIHAQDIIKAFKQYSTHHIYILFPDLRECKGAIDKFLILDTRNGAVKTIKLNFPITFECYKHAEWSTIAASIIHQYQIDIVHFFHLLHYPLNFPLIAKQSGAKVIVSFHDYFLVCPQFNLLKENVRFCGYPDASLSTCDLCLKQTFGYQPGTQETRRHLISQVLYHIDAVHYASQDQKSRIEAAYPYLQQKASMTMGVGLERSLDPILLGDKKLDASQPLTVACVGNFSINKGADLLLRVIDYYCFKGFSNIQINIYGNLHPPYEAVLKNIAQVAPLKLHGAYSPDQLPVLLKACDVALFASIWPETFVLALSEAWACGLIPIAPKLGAFQERIIHDKNGILYDPLDPGSIIDILNDLAAHREKLSHFLSEIHHVQYPSIKDNLTEYLALYEKVLSSPEPLADALARMVMTPYPDFWHSQSTPAIVQINPVQSSNLIKKAWRIYRQEGLNYMLVKGLKYIKVRLLKM